MENLEVAGSLTELADLLEIQGANPFRVRAYRNAVRTINGLTRSLVSMIEAEEDLTELPGIGKDMSGHIRELIETGELGRLREVLEEVPRGVVNLMKLEGVGPKKARKVWEELDVTTVDELETAVQAGRVEELGGFGKKSCEKILTSIEDFRKHIGRFLLSEVDALISPLLEHMKEAPGVERLEVAGSYRRRRETVGDVDLLALCEGDSRGVMDHFTAFAGGSRVEASGETRGRIVLRSGLPVDLRILPGDSYGAALHYFSGSKEHNVAIRSLAVRQGLRISEYGVFRGGEGDEGERLGGATEEEVFDSVGLPWISPLLREDRGEIQAAAQGELPRILELKDIRGDLQMHSTWSDGKQSIREMAEACIDRGYEYLALTDHSQAVTVANGLNPERVREQWQEIEEVRSSLPEIRILRSLEVDILKDGHLDMPDEILEGLDLVLVSVHSYMGMERTEMTERVIRAMEHPLVDVVAHPTGRILNRREPFAMDMDEVLRAASALDVAMELNANPRRLDLNDVHLMRARELGVKIIVSTDAHSVHHLDFMRYGVDQGRRGWLETMDVLNTQPLEEIDRWLGRKRG
ncbi:DNA polymerase/3'-5' exonuclease PolX [Gemmatimonadota bacterium]